MEEFVNLDTVPYDEKCVGVQEGLPAQLVEARRFVEMLEDRFSGFNKIRFKINRNPHDFGTYVDISLMYIELDKESLQQAQFVEMNIPSVWSDDTVYKYPECMGDIMEDEEVEDKADHLDPDTWIDPDMWVDPAGGVHYGNEEDPAAMYE